MIGDEVFWKGKKETVLNVKVEIVPTGTSQLLSLMRRKGSGVQT